MHIPLGMANAIMSSSTYNFNEFKTYLSFAFRTSGNCKLNTEIKNNICNHLSISQKTLNKHIQSLVKKKYFGYNPITNTLFINGLTKIKKLVYEQFDFDEQILTKASFALNFNEISNLKFLIFTATEESILKCQSRYKNRLKFKKYLVDNNLLKRYENGSDSAKRLIHKIYINKTKSKGDSIKKENPNHFGSNFFVDDNDYLGVSNSFISKRFNRTKSWGCKMKKKSSSLNLLTYSKKSKFIDSFPVTFNVRKYLSINCPLSYNKFYIKKDNNLVNVFERGYDEIKTNIKLTRRKFN